ncbi:LPXTG cell wall anchor domain-containing protein [Microbacterium oleivorans]|uniref:LPXTG cell wall anchor domain-containing protein n=1 Tax=Microbacterium TaxID=33882 RepID=UPI0033C945CD
MQPWSRRLARVGAVVAVALGVLVGAPSAANADVEDFSFDSLTVDYTLTRAEDGTSRMRVVEEFVARFSETDQNRGIRRVIPDEYDGQPLRPSLESAVDAEGDPCDEGRHRVAVVDESGELVGWASVTVAAEEVVAVGDELASAGGQSGPVWIAGGAGAALLALGALLVMRRRRSATV